MFSKIKNFYNKHKFFINIIFVIISIILIIIGLLFLIIVILWIYERLNKKKKITPDAWINGVNENGKLVLEEDITVHDKIKYLTDNYLNYDSVKIKKNYDKLLLHILRFDIKDKYREYNKFINEFKKILGGKINKIINKIICRIIFEIYVDKKFSKFEKKIYEDMVEDTSISERIINMVEYFKKYENLNIIGDKIYNIYKHSLVYEKLLKHIYENDIKNSKNIDEYKKYIKDFNDILNILSEIKKKNFSGIDFDNEIKYIKFILEYFILGVHI